MKAMNIVKVEWIVKDGRRVPSPIVGTEKTYPAELVLIAMGFTGPRDYALKAPGEGRGPENGVFVCGDMRTGQSLVVKAMADGLQTAEQMDEYLNL